MPRPRKPWTKTVAVQGVAVRLYERADRGGAIYREVRLGGGAKDRQSLQTTDRAHAVQLAEALAREVAHLKHAGRVGPLTVGQLAALYRAEVLPTLSAPRQRGVRGHLVLLAQHFPDALLVADLTQPRVDAYVAARRSGAIQSPRHRTKEPGARAGTIRNELQLVKTMTRWATQHRVDGRPLLERDPLAGVRLPAEANARRPVTTQARYEATLAKAADVDPRGRFACLLALARHTGRRVNALVNLRASDVLRTRPQVEAALAAVGQPLGAAAYWPHGALRFRAAYDKRQTDAVVPMSAAARGALDAYLRDHPRLGEAPLFPSTGDDAHPAHKMLAAYWLRRAETLAGLPKLERGGFHPYRRLWASERRHLPPQDVMAGGGWKSLAVMQTAYQHADPATTYAVVDLATGPPARSQGEGARAAAEGGAGAGP